MKILLVDDHLMLVEALSYMLTRYSPRWKICTASSKAEAMAFLKANPDCEVVLSDLSFHGKMEGYAITREVTARFPRTVVVILSMHQEQAFVRKALAEGAKGYILKTDAPEEISRAIESALAGERYLSSSVRKARTENVQAADYELSAREREIAELVKNGASSKMIGEKLKISPRTVEVHRRNIMKKLDVHNAAQLVAVLKD